jgi:hypothetical protein
MEKAICPINPLKDKFCSFPVCLNVVMNFKYEMPAF